MPTASLQSSDTVLCPVQLVVWGFTTVVGHFSTLDGAFPMTSYRHPGSSSAFTQGAKITFLVPFLNYSQILQEIQNHLELSVGNTDSMQLKFLVLIVEAQLRRTETGSFPADESLSRCRIMTA